MATVADKKTTQKALVKKSSPRTKAAPKQKTAVRAKRAPAGAAKKLFVLPKGGFAVIETGGKQYKVSSGQTLRIEKLPGTHKEGARITFDKVLLTHDGENTKIGTPYISGANIEAIFEKEGRGKKITIIKYKAKSRYLRKKGHRQPYTKIKFL